MQGLVLGRRTRHHKKIRLSLIMANRLYLKKNIDISELDWGRSVSISQRRLSLNSHESASKLSKASRLSVRIAARNLRDSLKGPLSLRWYRSLQLSPIELELVKGLCETQGADELIISSRRPVWRLGVTLVQELHLTPFVRGADARHIKHFRNIIEFEFNQASWVLGWPTVLLLNILLILLGVVLAGASLGLLFWGIAVLIVFIRSPLGMTSSALNRIDLWIALLCVLSGISSIIGSLLRLIHGKIRSDSRGD